MASPTASAGGGQCWEHPRWAAAKAKGRVCGSRGKPLLWCRGSKMGVLLEGGAALALPCSAVVGLPLPALRPAAVFQARKSWKIYFSNEPQGGFICVRCLLLALPFAARCTLPYRTYPILNIARGRAERLSRDAHHAPLWQGWDFQEMLLQTLSWLAHSRDHLSSVPSAQHSQGWKPSVSQLESAPGSGRQDLLHPPPAAAWGRAAGRVDAAWSRAGLCCKAMPCCCG